MAIAGRNIAKSSARWRRSQLIQRGTFACKRLVISGDSAVGKPARGFMTETKNHAAFIWSVADLLVTGEQFIDAGSHV